MMPSMVRRHRPVGWLLMAAALVLAALGGCGKKGPPVAPKSLPLPQVTELKGRLEGDTVFLSWRPVASDSRIKGYVVLRAQADAAKPPCPGCPRVFQKVGEPSAGSDSEAVEFSEPVPPGFIYTYKVQPVGSSGDPGPESNFVTIDRSAP
jgi:hypothetical protein